MSAPDPDSYRREISEAFPPIKELEQKKASELAFLTGNNVRSMRVPNTFFSSIGWFSG